MVGSFFPRDPGDLERELRRVLQVTEVRAYNDGDVVIEEGDPGDSLYIVLGGKAGVYRSNVLVKQLVSKATFHHTLFFLAQEGAAVGTLTQDKAQST